MVTIPQRRDLGCWSGVLVDVGIDRIDPDHVRDRQQIQNAGERRKYRGSDDVLVFRCERRSEPDVHGAQRFSNRRSRSSVTILQRVCGLESPLSEMRLTFL